uniref:DM2 domain-containing protein n=1 Tax=Setaria digitata TaxID=48799 RepID=A0A915PZI4_9BILA
MVVCVISREVWRVCIVFYVEVNHLRKHSDMKWCEYLKKLNLEIRLLTFAVMADVKGTARLPVEEALIRDAVARQIQQFGMDKLTSRIIREKLKETFDVDFSEHKAAIDKITMDVRFWDVTAIIETSTAEKAKSETNNSSKSNKSDSESDDGVVFTDRAPRKKVKETRKRKSSESDAELLEVGQKRRRAAVTARQPTRKRSKANADSGSKLRKKKSPVAFQGPYNVYCALTEDLAAVCGKRYMRRCDVIKAMWAYFRSNNLLDPKDKRYVLPDEPLMKIFKRRFLAFGLMKDLASHIIEPKFLDEEERAALEKFEAEEEARLEAESNNDNSNGTAGNVKPDDDSSRMKNDAEENDEEEDDDDDENESS